MRVGRPLCATGEVRCRALTLCFVHPLISLTVHVRRSGLRRWLVPREVGADCAPYTNI